MFLSKNIEHLRKRAGISQEELGKQIGVSKQTVCLYETGRREPRISTLIIIARYFAVSVDDLLVKDLCPAGSALGRNLKYLRKKEKYRQEDMAHLLGYRDKSSYCLIENGETRLSVDNLVNISEFFGVSVDDLLKKDLSKEG